VSVRSGAEADDCLEGVLEESLQEGREGGLPYWRQGIRDPNPEKRDKIGGEGGSCPERRGVVISITGGVEGAVREENRGLFFFSFFLLFYIHVFVVKVQETAWSASYGVNKTSIPTRVRFNPSWEKSNPPNPEHILPPGST